MAEYIKREDAIKSFLDADTDIMADYGPDYGAEWGFSRDRVKEILGSLLAADVAEVRHGRWSPVAFGIGICTTKYQCSVCKQYKDVDRPYKYCPNCGALMREDEHEVSEP